MGVMSRAIKPERTSVILLKWAPEHDDLKVKDEVLISPRTTTSVTNPDAGRQIA
jgi:hypothetical protein